MYRVNGFAALGVNPGNTAADAADEFVVEAAGGFGNLLNRGGWGSLASTTMIDYGITGKVKIIEK